MRHSFSRQIAREHGDVAALLLQYLAHSIETRGVEREGNLWFFHSLSDFKGHYPYLSCSTINAALKKLIGPVLIAGNFNRRKGDLTRWFRFVSEEVFQRALAKTEPVYFESETAEQHGVLEAILVDHLHHRGRELQSDWVEFSARAHAERIPYTKQRIQRALDRLVASGVLSRSREPNKRGIYSYRTVERQEANGSEEAGTISTDCGTNPCEVGTNSHEPGTNPHDFTIEKNRKGVGRKFEEGVTSAEPRDTSLFNKLPTEAVNSNLSDQQQDEDLSSEPTFGELIQENQNVVSKLTRDDLIPVYFLATAFFSKLNDEALFSFVGLESSQQMLQQYRRLVPTIAPKILKYPPFIIKLVEEAVVRAAWRVGDSSEQLIGHWGFIVYKVVLEVGGRVWPLQERITKRRRQDDLNLRRAELFTLTPQRLNDSNLSSEEKTRLLERGIQQLNRVGIYDSSGRFIQNYFDCHSSSLRAAKRLFDLNPQLTPAHLLDVIEAWSKIYYASEDPQQRAEAIKRKCSLSNLVLNLGMGSGLGVSLPDFVQPGYEELFGSVSVEDAAVPDCVEDVDPVVSK